MAKNPFSFRQKASGFAEAQRLRLSSIDALPQLALMGIVSGIATAIIIVGFRLLIDWSQIALLPNAQQDGFESLAPVFRFGLILLGAIVIGIFLQISGTPPKDMGVVHVMERLDYHQAKLPLRNALVQFFGAATAIISGHSVGREGPSIHLGAATASLLAQRLGLPNNSIRTLVGCGVAAAIAAGFNTPLAGVIFAMEVVLMEYTVAGFIPIILSAVSATTISRAVFGEDIAFIVPPWEWSSVAELPYVFVLGLFIGSIAGTFSFILMKTARFSSTHPIFLRVVIGGVFVGAIAIFVPEVMGVGYDTVNSALLGGIVLSSLVTITIAKILATSICIGLGSPGGLIGPTLFIGSTAGALVGLSANTLFDSSVSVGFYAMLGMGAMMAAVLQAPLAALLALLELTANPNAILPGMIAIVSAVMFSNMAMKQTSIYRSLMRHGGLDYRSDPMFLALRRIGIASTMHTDIARENSIISMDRAKYILKEQPRWIVIREETNVIAILNPADLSLYIQNTEFENEEEKEINLLEIPGDRLDVAAVDVLNSLQDAYEILQQSGKQALYVVGKRGAGKNKIYGVITLDDINQAYQGK